MGRAGSSPASSTIASETCFLGTSGFGRFLLTYWILSNYDLKLIGDYDIIIENVNGGEDMKRIVAIICAIAILCLCLPASATNNTYQLKEIGISVNIPSEFYVITRETQENDPALQKFRLSKTEADAMMKKTNCHLDAVVTNPTYEIRITGQNSLMTDFNDMGNTLLYGLMHTFEESYTKAGMNVLTYNVYDNSDMKWLKICIDTRNGFCVEYLTSYNNVSIAFGITADYDNSIDEMDLILCEIIDGVKFKNTPHRKEVVMTEPSTYIDYVSGTRLHIPANWQQLVKNKDDNYDVAYISTEDENCCIMFACIDMYGYMRENEEYTDWNMQEYQPSVAEVADFFGEPSDLFSMICIDNKEYYKYYNVIEDDTIGIYIPLIVLTYIENGYANCFYFMGFEETEQYLDFINVVTNATY